MTSNDIDYKRYILLLKRNKKLFITIALTIMTLITSYSFMLPNMYLARSTVFIEKSVIAELLKGMTFTPSTEDKIKALTFSLNSRTLITKIIDELDLDIGKEGGAKLEQLIKNLQENTQIQIKDKEGLFIVSFRNRNPRLARDYVNALIRRYIDENMSSKREESYGATQFLSEQLSTFKEKLNQAEDASNAFKRGAGAIATMDPSTLIKDINDSQQRADELKIKQAQLETVLANLGKVSSAQLNLPGLHKRLQELQLQYTDNYPEIIRLKDEIRALEEQKKSGQGLGRTTDSPEYERLNSELRAIRQAEANLRANIAKSRELLQRIPAARAELDNLEREKASQKNLYESMLSRQGQSEISKQMTVQDKSTVFRVVDPAIVPIKPIGPNRAKIILLGILAGIGAGFGLIIIKDLLDDSVKSVDMAKHFGLPVLAVIPRIEDPQQVALQSRHDRLLYVFSGVYLSMILAVLVLELLGITVISKLLTKLTS